jgi:hypothetical protein
MSGQQPDVRQPNQSTQTRDGQDGSRVFIEAHDMVKVIRPRRDPNEDRPAVKASVGETTTAVNRGEPPTVRPSMVKQQAARGPEAGSVAG